MLYRITCKLYPYAIICPGEDKRSIRQVQWSTGIYSTDN